MRITIACIIVGVLALTVSWPHRSYAGEIEERENLQEPRYEPPLPPQPPNQDEESAPINHAKSVVIPNCLTNESMPGCETAEQKRLRAEIQAEVNNKGKSSTQQMLDILKKQHPDLFNRNRDFSTTEPPEQ